MRKEHRSSEEIDIEILLVLYRNPGGIKVTQLMQVARLNHCICQEHLLRLGKEGLVKIEEREERLNHKRSGRGLLSNNPKTIVRRIVKITTEGKTFLKNKAKPF